MGKDKQRTKGGVKPSSSGRTAELLLKSQNVSFESQSVFSNYVPVITFGFGDFDSQDSTLSPDLRLLLRKLGKKDSTTKIKALGELTDICSQNEEACSDVLPYWPRIYSKLTADDSRKVRELCHGVLEVIGKTVGRNLAPHLKSIAPYWVLSQNDIFAPASSTALKSFKVVFSTDKKQKEAISYCKEETIALIIENLTTSASQNKPVEKKKGDAEEDKGSDSVVDSETYGVRMAYSSLITLSKLIELGVVDEAHCQTLMDSDRFWGLTKHPSSLVRRQLFNLITTIANWKSSLIQRQCIKAITQALKEETSDCLQSLWNCFLTLTLNCEVFTTDPNLTKSQLLKVCRKGFYGNASSLGPAVLPLVAKIGLDEELITQLLPALQAGYLAEKSTVEKSAILRAYGEALAFYLSSCPASSTTKLLNETVFSFIDTLITSGSARDFASCLGSLIKKDDFFMHLSDMLAGDDAEKWNTKECGFFLIALCSNDSGEPVKKLKSVKFIVDEPAVDPKAINYNELPDSKKSLIKCVAMKALKSTSLSLFSVLSSCFQCDTFYNDVTGNNPIEAIESSAFEKGDNDLQLSLVLDLIKTFPASPAFLGKLSTLFESQSESLPQLLSFISKLHKFVNIQAIKLWLKQDIFCLKVQQLITKSEYLGEEDALGVLRFVLENELIFGNEFVESIVGVICNQVSSCQNIEDQFLTKVLKLVKRVIEQQEVGATKIWKQVILRIWERLVHFAVTVRESDTEGKQHVNFLIDEFIGIIPPVGAIRDDVCHIIQQEVENVSSVNDVDTLVRLTTSVMCPSEGIQLTPILSLRFDKSKTEDLLNFTGLSYCPLKNSTVRHYEGLKEHLKTGFLTRTIYEVRLAMKSNVEEIVDLVTPLLKILYAQAVCILWRELEKFDAQKSLEEELATELTVLSSRWLEILASNKWNRWREEILDQLLKTNQDVLLSSKLPLQVFLKAAKKMELSLTFLGRSKSLQEFILEDSVSLESENALRFLETLIINYFMEDRVHDIIPVIDYLSLQRKHYAQFFNFEKLFAHVGIDSKQVMLNVLEIVILLMRRIADTGQGEAEDFYSTTTCWISAWLKQCKNLPSISDLDKLSLLWINKLATATSLVAEYARNTPAFATEYVGFHASNLYLPLHYLFLQLGSLNSTEPIVVRTIELVAVALSSVPSLTLSFIEPIPAKICANFTPFFENQRIALKILAYRIVKKVKPTASSGLESDDLPIVPTELNELIRRLGEEISATEISSLSDPNVLTYLLSWDALLTMHSDRSCNEFGNFSKESHLLPQLLSILFFQLIDLIPDSKFNSYFETVPVLRPDIIPPTYGHLVCSVLLKTMQCLPYPTRWWWNTQLSKQRDKSMVEKFIVRYLTSKLAADELGRVKWEESDNVTVHSHPGCNELIAHYKIEDTTVSLTIALPLNHPLGPIQVKISDKKLHGRIANLLNNRSNSLAAGLKMWKENLDAKYSGHEECAICFFILHNSTKALPKMVCKTCNHKFHSACLLKWFSTSNKSECPLCRNLF